MLPWHHICFTTPYHRTSVISGTTGVAVARANCILTFFRVRGTRLAQGDSGGLRAHVWHNTMGRQAAAGGRVLWREGRCQVRLLPHQSLSHTNKSSCQSFSQRSHLTLHMQQQTIEQLRTRFSKNAVLLLLCVIEVAHQPPKGSWMDKRWQLCFTLSRRCRSQVYTSSHVSVRPVEQFNSNRLLSFEFSVSLCSKGGVFPSACIGEPRMFYLPVKILTTIFTARAGRVAVLVSGVPTSGCGASPTRPGKQSFLPLSKLRESRALQGYFASAVGSLVRLLQLSVQSKVLFRVSAGAGQNVRLTRLLA